ncbi:hypothetical protein PoB_006489800 [Plakobranchus ocellatus]|uniref:Uncharacterized protein n=1 Tax=Plakobranchus ocellatus TaxID=259542 RepID=A0AAV4D2Y6_9GAST|nr:hypothetical protein PoB_006489800 [Plakobranchus ocellatus]
MTTTAMLHLEIVGSSPRPSGLPKFEYLEKPPATPPTPQAQLIRLPSSLNTARMSGRPQCPGAYRSSQQKCRRAVSIDCDEILAA